MAAPSQSITRFVATPDDLVAAFHRVANRFAAIDAVLHSRSGHRADTVVLFSHPRSQTNLTSYPGAAFAARGIDVLCFNNRFTNSPAGSDLATVFEEFALDIAAAVAHARELGYRSVLLTGHSAGGPMIAFYQNVAENGGQANVGPGGLSGFAGFTDAHGAEIRLPVVDGLIMRSITLGTAASFLIRLDGSVIDEDTAERDPELDMYDERNGFDPAAGAASYDATFLRTYHRAQARRMNALIERAEQRLASIHAGTGRFDDDEFTVIPRTRANPATVDLALVRRTDREYRLYPSGRLARVDDVRPINLELAQNRSIDGAAVHRTRPMLSYRLIRVDADRFDPSVRTADEMGIDFDSTNSSTSTNLRMVSVPLLMVQGSADESNSVKLSTAELIYAAAASADKTLVFVEGAGHHMRPIDPEFGDTRAIAADLVADWVERRFG